MKVNEIKTKIAKIVEIEGLVQGVGFRPFVYHLAHKYALNGFIKNTLSGVYIHIEGDKENTLRFISGLQEKAPNISRVLNIQICQGNLAGYDGFKIKTSDKNLEGITNISPDIAVCKTCLNEMQSPGHRYQYPFINCTLCGPRFTIIEDLPYDRKVTSMSKFEMCRMCASEYTDIYNRRYHAQPTACNHCGPVYSYSDGKNEIHGIDKIIQQVVLDFKSGKIIAVKGLGGYNLMCDATNKKTVAMLRKIKQRESKPFAVMFPDINSLKKYASFNSDEKAELCSWRKPIVILTSKSNLPFEVANGFNTVGAMLPYMPFHYLLFQHLQNPLICTSGNLSDEPIITDNNKAISVFSRHNIGIIKHNRDIVNRTDDSVVKIISGHTQIYRRSRGFVPEPLYTSRKLPTIVGAGAELTAHFALSKENLIIPSQYIGDLKNAGTLEFYHEAYERFCKMYRFKPDLAVHDLHPDYLSTQFAKELDIPSIGVQHHHAHVASCMLENNYKDKVVGICYDGTGLGEDGHIWGSECMIADYGTYEKRYSLDYVKLPGGDQAMKEPWRVMMAYLFKTFEHKDEFMNLPFIQGLDPSRVSLVLQALEKGINTPQSCGMGRLFDAVAALNGLCTKSGFHAEAPMRLENVINSSITDYYPFEIKNKHISTNLVIREMVKDHLKNTGPDVISAKFHNTIVQFTCEIAKRLRKDTGINTMVLSGGVFQNMYLLEKTEEKLKSKNFTILRHKQLPYNDGNIAAGQIAIAAKL